MTKFVIFGDSLSDTGQMIQKLGISGFALKSKLNNTHRFTKSHTWVDLLSKELGFPTVIENDREGTCLRSQMTSTFESSKLLRWYDSEVLVNYSESGALIRSDGKNDNTPKYKLGSFQPIICKTFQQMIDAKKDELELIRKDNFFGPTKYIIWLGANDIIGLRYNHLSLIESANTLATTAKELLIKDKGSKVYIVGTMPIFKASKWKEDRDMINYLIASQRDFNRQLQGLCNFPDELHFVEMSEKIIKAVDNENKEWKTEWTDSLHPSNYMHKLIYDVIKESVLSESEKQKLIVDRDRRIKLINQ